MIMSSLYRIITVVFPKHGSITPTGFTGGISLDQIQSYDPDDLMEDDQAYRDCMNAESDNCVDTWNEMLENLESAEKLDDLAHDLEQEYEDNIFMDIIADSLRDQANDLRDDAGIAASLVLDYI